MLKLRPHHINCLFFYRGNGYSKEFVDKLSEIHKIIKLNPRCRVLIVNGCDDICVSCPNRDEGKCITENKVVELDNKTLNEFGLELKEYKFSDFIENIYSIYTESNLYNICSECEWFKQGICKKEIIEEHKKYWVR